MKIPFTLLATALVCLLSSLCLAMPDDGNDIKNTAENPSADDLAFFEAKIRPLLIERCFDCHSVEDPESGLSLESRAAMLSGGELGPAIVPGKPKESLLISAINHDEFLKMPPDEKLPTADVVHLTKWVQMGAPWPGSNTDANEVTSTKEASEDSPLEFTDEQRSFWAYQPVTNPQLPTVEGSDWVRTPIDAFILENLEAAGLTPAPPAARRDLIRRATYDLTGLPPTPDEIQAFLDDDSPEAFAELIDRLLASPGYGEHWGRHWLDVVRYADSNGLDENIAYANAFRYRDYVISSFNADKPYDLFVREQIAGDLLNAESTSELDDEGKTFERYVATGFLTIGAKMLAEDDPTKMQMDIIDEQINTVCQAFMGMTIGCARCHDHKFDPIPTADYYSLAGIFKSTKTMENHNVVAKWYERPLVTKSQQQEIDSIAAEMAATEAALQKIKDETRRRAAETIRGTVADALLATIELEAFEAQAQTELRNGLNQATEAYAIRDGYVLIEAEGFQRGNIARDSTNYGDGIGVLLSDGAGFAEYDLDVQHAGEYALELRYTAAESRPIRVLINDVEVASGIAQRTTGSWHPDGQSWFVETVVELQAGKNVLKFDAPQVYPHIDKLALVFQVPGQWPFGNVAPLALSRIATGSQSSFAILYLWKDSLANVRRQLAEDKPTNPTACSASFLPWLRFRDIQDDFALGAQVILAELAGDTALAQQTPEPLRQALIDQAPGSLEEVANVYQQVIHTELVAEGEETDSDESLRKQSSFLSDSSPLNGPGDDMEAFYSDEERKLASDLEHELADLEKSLPQPPMAMGVEDAQPEDLRIHLRGNHIVLGKTVPRQFPQIVAGTHQKPLGTDRSGRLELARWMTEPDHPLTSRVMVNRIWHWHFGRGIVPTVDNFGALGERPTHPELLDWLATKFVADDWSLKRLHRTIMLSQTYQMSTQYDARSAEVDPENGLLWRFRRRRLSAEETRDSIIATGSGIDTKMFGTLLAVENHKYVNSTDSATALDYGNRRRSVYLPVIRSGVYDVLQALDFPDPAVINGQRQVSIVAPQALLMMNSELVAEQMRLMAEQLMQDGDDDAQRISWAYQRVLGRSPGTEEIIAAATFLKDARLLVPRDSEASDDAEQAPSADVLAWQSLCRVLISSNEFSYIE